MNGRQWDSLRLVEAAQSPITLPTATARALARRGYIELALVEVDGELAPGRLWRATEAGRRLVERQHRLDAHEACSYRLYRHPESRAGREWGKRCRAIVEALYPELDWPFVHDIEFAASTLFIGMRPAVKHTPDEELVCQWAEQTGEIVRAYDDARARAKTFGRKITVDFVADVGGAVERAGRRERVAEATEDNVIDLGKLLALRREDA